MLASELLNIEGFDEGGVFDPVVDGDSRFFINIIRLKQTKAAEFLQSYEKINGFFSDIATILQAAEHKNENDKFFRVALKKFNFPEVNGINLGFAQSVHGAGFGKILRAQVISDAYDIVKKGCTAPELFHLIGLFEENVGPDRISDMIAAIILPDIKDYTLKVYDKYCITPDRYPEQRFIKQFLINPFKKCPLYFLPVDILHKLPIAECWEQVDSAVSENEAIRAQINIEIGSEWEKWASSQKKNYLKQNIFMVPKALEDVINSYRTETLGAIDIFDDSEYFVETTWKRLKAHFYFLEHSDKRHISSIDGAIKIIDIFKDWVENNKGWVDVQNADSRGQEKSVQRLMYLGAKDYIKNNNLDMSCEPNGGPGPVDFKVSRGNDKTVIEVKLSSNSKYMQGYEKQVIRYAEAEHTDNAVYVLIDVGNDIRVRNLQELHEQNIKAGKEVPELIVIDARTQKSASNL